MSVPLAQLRNLPIRLRLGLWFALFLLASVVGIGVLLLSLLELEFQREIDESLLLRAARVEREISADGIPNLDPRSLHAELLELTPLEEFAMPGLYVEVLDQHGRVVAASASLVGGALPLTADLLAAAAAGQALYATLPAGTERVRVLLRPLTNEGLVLGAIVVGESLHLLDATSRTMRQILVFAAMGAALACLVAALWLTGRALQPISDVASTARRIRTTGRFGERIAEPRARDELRELAVTFNEMLDSLERTFAHQQQFVADASHELRGPLTVIRGNLNLLGKNPPDIERDEALGDASEEAVRMSRLVDDLLFLAEPDTREMVDRQVVPLQAVMDDVLERASRLDGGAHEVLAVKNEPADVVGDRERLVQMLWNLVENALRYTPAGGRIELALRSRNGIAELTVKDAGPGIGAQDLPHIFDRFYRVDKVRSREQGGTGLGLAIVKQIAEIHGGQVEVESQLGEGTTFTVTLPAGRAGSIT